MEEELKEHLDSNLIDVDHLRNLTSHSFIAGYLQLLTKSAEFQEANCVLKQKIKHLSYLVHLLCRFDDFEIVFQEYKIVKVGSWTNCTFTE